MNRNWLLPHKEKIEEIIQLVSEGYPSEEIAGYLRITERQVHFVLANAKKSEVIESINLAIKNGGGIQESKLSEILSRVAHLYSLNKADVKFFWEEFRDQQVRNRYNAGGEEAEELQTEFGISPEVFKKIIKAKQMCSNPDCPNKGNPDKGKHYALTLCRTCYYRNRNTSNLDNHSEQASQFIVHGALMEEFSDNNANKVASRLAIIRFLQYADPDSIHEALPMISRDLAEIICEHRPLEHNEWKHLKSIVPVEVKDAISSSRFSYREASKIYLKNKYKKTKALSIESRKEPMSGKSEVDDKFIINAFKHVMKIINGNVERMEHLHEFSMQEINQMKEENRQLREMLTNVGVGTAPDTSQSHDANRKVFSMVKRGLLDG